MEDCLQIADEVGISVGSTDRMRIPETGMHRVTTKFVPKLLSLEQRQLHFEVSENMLQCANRDPEFLKTWSLVMRCGCMIMTQKLRSSCNIGSTQVPRWPKKHNRFGAR